MQKHRSKIGATDMHDKWKTYQVVRKDGTTQSIRELRDEGTTEQHLRDYQTTVSGAPTSPANSKRHKKKKSKKHKKHKSSPAKSVSQPAHADADTNNCADNTKKDIEALIRKHDPEKVPLLEKLFAKYQGSERTLRHKLRKKYGEGGDSGDDGNDDDDKEETNIQKESKRRHKRDRSMHSKRQPATEDAVAASNVAADPTSTIATTVIAPEETEPALNVSPPRPSGVQASSSPSADIPPAVLREISLLLDSAYGVLTTPAMERMRRDEVLQAYNFRHDHIVSLLRQKVKQVVKERVSEQERIKSIREHVLRQNEEFKNDPRHDGIPEKISISERLSSKPVSEISQSEGDFQVTGDGKKEKRRSQSIEI